MNGNEGAIRRQEAARWLTVAAEDIRVGRACLRMDPPAIGVAAYHAHQAAEKLLKGLLVVASVEFRMTHDLDWLANAALPRYPELRDGLDVLRPLTSWGIAYRYPGPEPEPEPLPPSGDVERVIDLLGELAARLRAASVA